MVLTQYYSLVRNGLFLSGVKIMRVMLTFADNLCYFTLICARALYSDCLVWVCFCLTLSGSFLKAARTGLLPPIQKRPAVGDSAVKVLPLSACDFLSIQMRKSADVIPMWSLIVSHLGTNKKVI